MESDHSDNGPATPTYEELALKDIIDATTYNNTLSDSELGAFVASGFSDQRDFYLARAQVYAMLSLPDRNRTPHLEKITMNGEITSDLLMFTNYDMN